MKVTVLHDGISTRWKQERGNPSIVFLSAHWSVCNVKSLLLKRSFFSFRLKKNDEFCNAFLFIQA